MISQTNANGKKRASPRAHLGFHPKQHEETRGGIIVNFYPKFTAVERYFYDSDNREILSSNGMPFQDRQMNPNELARAPKTSCFQSAPLTPCASDSIRMTSLIPNSSVTFPEQRYLSHAEARRFGKFVAVFRIDRSRSLSIAIDDCLLPTCFSAFQLARSAPLPFSAPSAALREKKGSKR